MNTCGNKSHSLLYNLVAMVRASDDYAKYLQVFINTEYLNKNHDPLYFYQDFKEVFDENQGNTVINDKYSSVITS